MTAQLLIAATILWVAVMAVNAGMWLMVAWAVGTDKARISAAVWNMISGVILSVAVVLTVRRWL